MTTLMNDAQPEYASVDFVAPMIMSLMAGMSTCVGAAVVFWKRKLDHRHMSFSLTLAGSVMITVSFTSILPECFFDEKANKFLYVGSIAFWQRCIAFGIGAALYLLLSKFAFPEPDSILFDHDEEAASMHIRDVQAESTQSGTERMKANTTFQRKRNTTPSSQATILSSSSYDEVETIDTVLLSHSERKQSPEKEKSDANNVIRWSSQFTKGNDLASDEARRAWRVAMLLFVSLAAHNFPEGLAVAASAMHSPQLGLTTTIAIALHNIPEGIAIAIPCLAARPDSPWLAFGLASLSGLAEPLGAAVALIVLGGHNKTGSESTPSLSHVILNMNNVLAFVAGIMIMVALIELFPEAKRHMQEDRMYGVFGTATGMIVMIASDAYLDS